MSYSLKASSRFTKPVIVGLSIFVAALVIGGFLVSVNWYYQQQLDPVSQSETTQLFEVATGDSTQAVAVKLEEAGLIRASWAFSWYMRTQGLRGDLQAGTYAIKPNQSVQEIARIITAQDEGERMTVTILPERRLDQVRDDLINAGFSPDEVDTALESEQYVDHPALSDKPSHASLEGYLYPETFHIDETTSAQDVIELSLDEMANRLTPDVRQAIEDRGLTVHEGIILASIVEREVTEENPQDRPQVAQVFYRRISEGVRLESNATWRYGAVMDGLDPSEHPNYDSPYNTYRYDGLTPSPISNVSESSISAVANPADTNYLYFVSDDGCMEPGEPCTNYFSETLEEHETKVQRYCPVRCAAPH